MKAFELHPEDGFDALKLVDRQRPVIGPGDVRVRVRAVSLNYRDLMVARGSKKRAKRIVPSSDGAGEVTEIGSGVKRLAIGDRVAAAFFPSWIDGPFAEEHHTNALGGSLDGMLAQEVVLPERAWVKIPPRYSFEQASTLPCAGVTAWHALFEAAEVTPGEIVLVQGGGGVSTFALQLARAAGARVIATSSSAEKRGRLAQMGSVFDDRLQSGREVGRHRKSRRRWRRRSRGGGGRSRDVRSKRRVAALRRPHQPARHPRGHAGAHQHLRHLPQEHPHSGRLCRIGRDVRAAGSGAGAFEC